MTHGTDERTRIGGTGVVLLAAGASVRMGTPKQLLNIEGVSMIRRATENALNSGCEPVVVVLGASAELIAPELQGLPVVVAVNPDWRSGMSSSIRVGLAALLAVDSQIQSVILFLGDQPKVTASSLRKLATTHKQSSWELVAASYSNNIGTPALFSRTFFDELLQLEGPGGAKELLQRYASRVLAIESPEAACDLDTPEDLASFHFEHMKRACS